MKDRPRVRVKLCDPEATARLAACLAQEVGPGDIIALHGDLGAGKTTFARAFITGLLGAQEVPSPTFNLVQTYEAEAGSSAPPVWHFDLYRLEDPSEVWELGIDEAFDQGVSLIEWPERLPNLPKDHLQLNLRFGKNETERVAELEGGPSWTRRLQDLARQLPGATIVNGER